MLFEPVKLADQKARIAVVGVGGAGGNALNRMIVSGLESVEFIAVNTDAQDLDENNSQIKMQIGRELTKGLGVGANADVGNQAVEENRYSSKAIRWLRYGIYYCRNGWRNRYWSCTCYCKNN